MTDAAVAIVPHVASRASVPRQSEERRTDWRTRKTSN